MADVIIKVVFGGHDMGLTKLRADPPPLTSSVLAVLVKQYGDGTLTDSEDYTILPDQVSELEAGTYTFTTSIPQGEIPSGLVEGAGEGDRWQLAGSVAKHSSAYIAVHWLVQSRRLPEAAAPITVCGHRLQHFLFSLKSAVIPPPPPPPLPPGYFYCLPASCLPAAVSVAFVAEAGSNLLLLLRTRLLLCSGYSAWDFEPCMEMLLLQHFLCASNASLSWPVPFRTGSLHALLCCGGMLTSQCIMHWLASSALILGICCILVRAMSVFPRPFVVS